MKGRISCVLLLAALSAGANAQITCATLNGAYVVGQNSANTYLGFFGSEFASESIMNPFGNFGSAFSSTSVRNQFSQFGSPFSQFSATNQFAGNPPIIARRGNFVAFLSTNSIRTPRVTLGEIDAACEFTASGPDRQAGDPLPQPPGGSTPPSSPPQETGMGGFDISLMGTWWNPARAGEGIMIDLANRPGGGGQGAFVAWYTYDPNGFQMFLTGYNDYNPLTQDSITFDMVYTQGPTFGLQYSADDLEVYMDGRATIHFLNCEQATWSFESEVDFLESFSIELVRLLPRQTGLTCP